MKANTLQLSMGLSDAHTGNAVSGVHTASKAGCFTDLVTESLKCRCLSAGVWRQGSEKVTCFGFGMQMVGFMSNLCLFAFFLVCVVSLVPQTVYILGSMRNRNSEKTNACYI